MMLVAIPTGDKAVVILAEALDRARGLSEYESRILQRAMTRGTGAFRRWTAADDAKLLKMRRAKLGAAHMASVLNRSQQSIYARLRDLKKAMKAKRHG